MDQKKFKKKMNNEEILPITNDELQATINESFSTFGKQEMPKGAYNVVIARTNFMYTNKANAKMPAILFFVVEKPYAQAQIIAGKATSKYFVWKYIISL